MDDLISIIFFIVLLILMFFGAIIMGILLIFRQRWKHRQYPVWLQIVMYGFLAPVLLEPIIALMSMFVNMNRPADYANMPEMQHEDNMLRFYMNISAYVPVIFVWLLLRVYRMWGKYPAIVLIWAGLGALMYGFWNLL